MRRFKTHLRGSLPGSSVRAGHRSSKEICSLGLPSPWPGPSSVTTLEIQIGSQRRCQSVQLRHGPAEPLGSGGGGEHALSRSDSLTWKWKTTWFVKKRQSSKGPGHPCNHDYFRSWWTLDDISNQEVLRYYHLLSMFGLYSSRVYIVRNLEDHAD